MSDLPRAEEDGILNLPSGREIYPNHGYVGINNDLELSTGYDDTFEFEHPFRQHDSWTQEDRLALCVHMIKLWTQLLEKETG